MQKLDRKVKEILGTIDALNKQRFQRMIASQPFTDIDAQMTVLFQMLVLIERSACEVVQ